MNLNSCQYTLSNYMFEIYISGCEKHPCKECFSPELWNPFVGDELTTERYELLKTNILSKIYMIENLMVCGGEILEKPKEEVLELITFLKQFMKPIWLFTRFELKDVDTDILDNIDYIKTGMYLQDKQTEDNISYGYKLASSNQTIYKKIGSKWEKDIIKKKKRSKVKK